MVVIIEKVLLSAEEKFRSRRVTENIKVTANGRCSRGKTASVWQSSGV